ncbi:iron ABC transporter substrate-binding protein [Streptococcus pneumoniae]|nr:iron ABC transporter substrate-binding protein [Streptococcus pneumoniae]
MKNKFFLIAILAMCIVFSACSSNSVKNEENTSKEHAPDKIVLDHAFGQTILDKKPERVATIAWGNHDVALALGIVPVGLSKANYGVSADKGVLPWTEEKKRDIMALNYKPLWIQLAKKGLKKTDVIAMAGLTTNVMAQMGKDKPITFKNLERICKALSCTPNDIISFEDNFSDEE